MAAPSLAVALDWSRLLTATRQRALQGGPESHAGDDDVRTAFERDYDRSLFAAPVRRLQDKAQVFPLEPNDSVRTRLTHSLEVSTIARQLAAICARRLEERDAVDAPQAAAITHLAATAGLLHDLGNPPFGHSGEQSIQSWFAARASALRDPASDAAFRDLPEQMQADFLRFEGNAQTIRIVARLQVLSDLHGLNLTAGALSVLGKYVAPAHEARPDHENHAWSKPGWFASERDLVLAVRETTGTGEARHPVTFIVEAADDIVYSIIDLEDGVKKGMLDWATLAETLATQAPDSARLIESAERRVDRGPMRLAGRARDEACIGALRTAVIGETVRSAATAFNTHYDDIMRGAFGDELVKAGPAAPLVKACKRIGREHVYCAAEVLRLEIMGERVLHDLMDDFWSAASAWTPDWIGSDGAVRTTSTAAKIYALLSKNYRAVFEHAVATAPDEAHRLYARLQLVTDNIAGMTDTYACTLHRRLRNAGGG